MVGVHFFFVTLFVLLRSSEGSSSYSCPAYKTIEESERMSTWTARDLDGEWFVIANTEKNACKCKTITTKVNPIHDSHFDYDTADRCVSSDIKWIAVKSKRGFSVHDKGHMDGYLLEGKALPFGGTGPLQKHMIFDHQARDNNEYLFSYSCSTSSFTIAGNQTNDFVFRILARNSTTLPDKTYIQRLIDNMPTDVTAALDLSDLALHGADEWHHCNSSLPEGECGAYFGRCQSNYDCCKGAGMGHGYFCDACD